MNGIFAIVSHQKPLEIQFSPKWKEPFSFQPEHINRVSANSHYHIAQYTINKFLDDKIWIFDQNYICVTDGVIYNLETLKKRHNVKDTQSLLSHYFQNQIFDFFKEFEGNFVGVFYNKHSKTWYGFNNQTGTKKLYYYSDSNYLVLSTDLGVLAKSLKQLNITLLLDEKSGLLLLSNGYMLDNKTLLNEVKQLRAGEYLFFSHNKLELKYYYNLQNITRTADSKEEIIENLDRLFKAAIKLCFEKETEYGYQHFTTLSGGLDSRMTSLIAYKLGYKNQTLINFSEKGFADEIIAQQIANHYGMRLINITLNAKNLTAIDDVVKVNNGETIYTGCSHVFSTLNCFDSKTMGFFHTGLIGDAVLGSFLSKPYKIKPNALSSVYGKNISRQAVEIMNEIAQHYKTEELYKFYNRAFLGANNGCSYFDLIGETTSPFLNSEFLTYAYSIPEKYKYKQHIYIEWIKAKHPDIANFIWEAIGGKPTNNRALRIFYRTKRAVIKRLPIPSMWKRNMTPEQYWYDTNTIVKSELDSYYSKHIHLLDSNLTLKTQATVLYDSGNIEAIAEVLTLLGAIKLLLHD